MGRVGEKKFIISSNWWRKWCDYANFGEAMDIGTFVNFNNLNNIEIDSEKHSLLCVYEKPGIIDNEYYFLE